MSNQKNYKKFIAYVIILFFSITGFVYAVASNNQEQIKATGGTNDTNTNGEKDGVVVSKTISPTDTENFFDITLTVDTESRVDEIMTDPDIAIVLVMDLSYTMYESHVSDGTTTRLKAAQNASAKFIEEFAKEAADTTTALRQLGFVAFNTNGHEIFPLTKVKNISDGESLKTEMLNETKRISENDKWPSHNRFTNIEAGLEMANDMLATTKAKNKYIVFLSDGFPTTYLDKTTSDLYDGYDPYMSTNPKISDEGKFYNEVTNKPCTYGTNYSDRGAIKARIVAQKIKNSGINIFSVGTGLVEGKVQLVDNMDSSTNSYSIVDTETADYEIGKDLATFHEWLKNSIGSGYYYDTDSNEELIKAYLQIFEQVKTLSEKSAQATWVAEDPMGSDGTVKNIEFIGLYDNNGQLQESLTKGETNQTDTASFKNNQITWDLKKSQYTESKEGTKTTYHYELKYRVRLENELSTFEEGTIYSTNGYTKLTYVTRTDDVLSDNKEIAFPEPSVIGYLGELEFTKISSYDGRTLEGAEFELIHDETNCTCHNAYLNMKSKKVNIPTMKASSDKNGKVLFNNVPSGHTYKLVETKAPDNHNLPQDNEVMVSVNYGKTTSEIPSTGYKNDIKTGSITLYKIVEGNTTNPGIFQFNLEIYFEGNTIKNEVISLQNGESKTISNLPVGSTYKITETTTNGYKVQFNINKTGEILGDTATCNSSNCSIKEGAVNTVTFTNIAGYILPATGSSGMLILVIIGTLLLVGPVIYIGYSFFKKKED